MFTDETDDQWLGRTSSAAKKAEAAFGIVLFVQSFLLAAHSLGVATIPQAGIASQAPFIRKYFNLPADRKVLLGMSFGYADESHPANNYRTERQTVEEVLTQVTT